MTQSVRSSRVTIRLFLMKRRNKKARKYSIIVTRKRTWRAIRSKRLAFLYRFYESSSDAQRPGSQRSWKRWAQGCYQKSRFTLVAPEVFGVQQDEQRSALLSFLRQLRRITLQWHCRVCIDFSKVKLMQPAGTLLFAAELDRILRAISGKALIRCTYPVDNVVEQVLQHLGLLQAMKRQPRCQVSAENVKFWHFESDNEANGERVEKLATEYRQLFTDAKRNRMYDGLVEAMTNCVQHAYAQKRQDGMMLRGDRRWWMFSEGRDGKLAVAFCDLGMGIDRSLKSGKKWGIRAVHDLVASLGRKHPVSRYIKAATELGRSSTNQHHRGKGLQDLKNVIESIEDGWMEILSNEGSYRFRGNDRKETLRDFRDSILGTLICWQIPIPGGEQP